MKKVKPASTAEASFSAAHLLKLRDRAAPNMNEATFCPVTCTPDELQYEIDVAKQLEILNREKDKIKCTAWRDRVAFLRGVQHARTIFEAATAWRFK